MAEEFDVPLGIRTGDIVLVRPQGPIGYAIALLQVAGAVLTLRPKYPYSHAAPVWARPEWPQEQDVTVDAAANGLSANPLMDQVRGGASLVLLRPPFARPPDIEERAERWFKSQIGKVRYGFWEFLTLGIRCPLGWRPQDQAGDEPRLRRRAICSAWTSRTILELFGRDPIPWVGHRWTIPSDFADPEAKMTVLTRELKLKTATKG